jgi:hypothetical protein
MKNKVLYLHITEDTNEIFYIGIGNIKRPYIKDGRNKYWHHIVDKHGYRVEVIKENLCIEDACRFEKQLISKYKEMGLAKCNMTEGGDSHFGFRHPKETIEKIRNAQLGCNNSRAIKVIDISTNRIYNTIKEAAKDLNISRQHLSEKLKGTRPNNTNIKYLTES